MYVYQRLPQMWFYHSIFCLAEIQLCCVFEQVKCTTLYRLFTRCFHFGYVPACVDLKASTLSMSRWGFKTFTLRLHGLVSAANLFS